MVVLVLSSQVNNKTQTSNKFFLNLVYVLFLKTSLGSSTLVAGCSSFSSPFCLLLHIGWRVLSASKWGSGEGRRRQQVHLFCHNLLSLWLQLLPPWLLQVLPSLSASQDGLIVVWETTIGLNFWFLLRVAVILLLFVLPNQNIQKFISTNLHWCVHNLFYVLVCGILENEWIVHGLFISL